MLLGWNPILVWLLARRNHVIFPESCNLLATIFMHSLVKTAFTRFTDFCPLAPNRSYAEFSRKILLLSDFANLGYLSPPARFPFLFLDPASVLLALSTSLTCKRFEERAKLESRRAGTKWHPFLGQNDAGIRGDGGV
jgi:hypothetical protein